MSTARLKSGAVQSARCYTFAAPRFSPYPILGSARPISRIAVSPCRPFTDPPIRHCGPSTGGLSSTNRRANVHFIRGGRRGLDIEIYRRCDCRADGQGRSNYRRTARDHREVPAGQQLGSEAPIHHYADTRIRSSLSGGIPFYRRDSSRGFHVEFGRTGSRKLSCCLAE